MEDQVVVHLTNARLRELQERIENGQYIVQAEKLAERLIDDVLADMEITEVTELLEVV